MNIRFRDFEQLRLVPKGKEKLRFVLLSVAEVRYVEALDLTVARASEWVSSNNISLISIETVTITSVGRASGNSTTLRHDQSVRIWYHTN